MVRLFTLIFSMVASTASADEIAVAISARVAAAEDRASLQRRIDRVNALYADVGVCFSLDAVEALAPGPMDLVTRQDRDALADTAARPAGVIEMFLVRSARDLNPKAGNIAGVHWRYGGKAKKHAGRRWVILSSTDSSMDTLAHELGHWFGLGHEKTATNLMAQSHGRDDTQLTAAQREKIRRSLAAALARGELRKVEAGCPAAP